MDWDFIICNDGSTEGKILNLLKKYEVEDKRIYVISYEPNHGLSYALNECMKVSKRRFIVFLEDDDISKLKSVQEVLEFIENHQVHLLEQSPFAYPSVLIREEEIEKVR